MLGVLRAPAFPAGIVEEALSSLLGPLDWRGPELPFTYTDYYEAEMGSGLLRTFYSFSRLVDPADLWRVKRDTDALERGWAGEGGRPVNLDPGLLSLARFVLATTKDRSHRIPLHGGIYAELTLQYEGGGWRSLPWTYADWKSPAYLAALDEVRALLKADLKRA